MHEFAVTQNMLDLIINEATQAGAKKVKIIRLSVGEISSFVDESIQMYFNHFSKGTIAEGADLIIHHIPLKLTCNQCGHVFIYDKLNYDCPQCSGYGSPGDKGREFFVESIEIDE
ncbi:MAG: hydrogenase maturation nickel metallochaperone HypA [Spirochaetes bacterium]|nr:hydrogenase maturation nickel metallochaperone HypA [Spirochaetota bacterium]